MASSETLKKYQKKKLENFKKINELKINDDEIYITLKVDKIEDITDKFCEPNSISLNEEFLNTILKKASYIPLDYPLVLEIYNKSFTSSEKIRLRKLIKNHFALEKINKEVELQFLHRKCTIFLCIGIIFFILLGIIHTLNILNILSEFISVIASFSIWESFEIFLFEGDDLKEEIIKYSHLEKIRIVFNKDS